MGLQTTSLHRATASKIWHFICVWNEMTSILTFFLPRSFVCCAQTKHIWKSDYKSKILCERERETKERDVGLNKKREDCNSQDTVKWRDVLFERCGNGCFLSCLHVFLGEEAKTSWCCGLLWRALGFRTTNASPNRRTITCSFRKGHFNLRLSPEWNRWLGIRCFRTGGVVAQALPFAQRLLGNGRRRFGFWFFAIAFPFVWWALTLWLLRGSLSRGTASRRRGSRRWARVTRSRRGFARVMGAAAAPRAFAWRAGARAPPFGAVVIVGLLLVTVASMPVVGAITVRAATTPSSSVVATWIVTATPATVVIEGSPVATESTRVPPVALKISRWVVSVTTMGTGARSGARGQKEKTKSVNVFTSKRLHCKK